MPAACQPFQSLAGFIAGFGLGGGEGSVDEVLGDEAVEDVEDGVEAGRGLGTHGSAVVFRTWSSGGTRRPVRDRND